MTVVIDTNVVLTMFKRGHPTRLIFEAVTEGRLRWALNTDILLEYEETVAQLTSRAYFELMLRAMDAVNAARQKIWRLSPSFRFRLIATDPDDDKFVDCAIAAEADFIITVDRHFDALRGSGFKPQPIAPADFSARYL